MTAVSTEAAAARDVAEASREREWTRPSFGRELFLGHLRPDLIWPVPQAPQEDRQRGEAFLRELESFLVQHVDPELIEREDRIPTDVVKGLRELGAFGMKIDREYGGLGLSTTYYNRALMLAASAHSSLAVLLSAHQSIGVPQPLKMFGTKEQKERFLPRCAAGAISAFLLTEPEVGSDPAKMTAQAEPTADGYRISGTKLWTTNGVIAELLVVMATVPKSDGHPGGITAFVVEADSPGITVLRRNEFMGLRGIENGVTRFEDVLVPAENRIGEEGEGLKIALRTLNTGRLSVPATCAAAGKGCLKIVREWSKERVQWGRPVGEHEAVASKIAYIAATSYALDAVVEVSSALADAGQTDIRIEAALAKLWASEAAWQVADTMVQIRGGRGFEKASSLAARGERPVPAEQILRDLRINRIFEGSTEIMHLLIAREAVDQHLSLVEPVLRGTGADRRTAVVKAGRFYAGWLPTLVVGKGQRPDAYSDWGALAKHVRYAERACRKLARATVYGMGRWREGLEFRQVYLGRLVDIGAELFALMAVCVRARENGAADEKVADLFCRHARQRVEDLFHQLHHNTDRRDAAIAQDVLDSQLERLEVGVLDLSGDLPFVGVPDDGVTRNVHRAV
jgi:alkylation response protein AidB-like acyl-CoA dehydrogenase